MSGAPFAESRPIASSSRLVRWKPSIGTTGTAYAEARAAARADFPAPGAPVNPSTNRPDGSASTRAAISRPSAETDVRPMDGDRTLGDV